MISITEDFIVQFLHNKHGILLAMGAGNPVNIDESFHTKYIILHLMSRIFKDFLGTWYMLKLTDHA